jgi:carboxylesterase
VAYTPSPVHLKGGSHAVLLFHGLSSSPQELMFLARGLHKAGYTVHLPIAPDYTYGLIDNQTYYGHKGLHVEWVQWACAEFDALSTQYDHISVGGLCVGSVLALRLASLRSDRIHSLLAMSSILEYDGWGNPWYTRLLPLAKVIPFTRRIGIREQYPFGLKDERMRNWVQRQMERNGQSTAGAATLRVGHLLEARELIRQTVPALPQVCCPTLLLHAQEDECATPENSARVARTIRSPVVHSVLLNNSYHMISIDLDKERVLSELLSFLGNPEKPAQE